MVFKTAPKAKDGKTAAAAPGGKAAVAKPRRTTPPDRYTSFIVKLLKNTHPDAGLTKTASLTMDAFLRDLIARLATEAGRVTSFSKRTKIASKDIFAASEIVLPSMLFAEAVPFAEKTLTTYLSLSAAEAATA